MRWTVDSRSLTTTNDEKSNSDGMPESERTSHTSLFFGIKRISKENIITNIYFYNICSSLCRYWCSLHKENPSIYFDCFFSICMLESMENNSADVVLSCGDAHVKKFEWEKWAKWSHVRVPIHTNSNPFNRIVNPNCVMMMTTTTTTTTMTSTFVRLLAI